MELFLQICGVGILTALLTMVLRRTSAPLGVLLSVACCVALGMLALQVVRPILQFLQTLQQTANLSGSLMKPLLKTVGVGILTQITSAVCQDAGESAMAKMVELCGGVVALYLALPLLTAVLTLLNQLTGG